MSDPCKRLIWISLLIPRIPVFFVVGGFLIFAQLIWCAIGWVITGKDLMLEANTPMGWGSTGWRWSSMVWPLTPPAGEKGE